MARVWQNEILSKLIEREFLLEVADCAHTLELQLVLDLFSHATAIDEVGDGPLSLNRDLGLMIIERTDRLPERRSPLMVLHEAVMRQQQESSQSVSEKFYILLGNLGIEGVSFRDAILQTTDLYMTIKHDLETCSPTLTEKIMWMLSILMREEPKPSKRDVRETMTLPYSSPKSTRCASSFRSTSMCSHLKAPAVRNLARFSTIWHRS